MTPQARVQAAIELLDQIVEAARDGGAAADTLIARYFKTRRYAGAKDRRAVREHVYAAIRRTGDRPVSGRAAMIGLVAEQPELGALFDGTPHAPAVIRGKEPASIAAPLPGWLAERLKETVPLAQQASLLERAPLDVRVNRLHSDRDTVRAMLEVATDTPHAPYGLRLPEGFAVEGSVAWDQGLIEIQDEGSQLIALACRARPDMVVVDLCAGAGGKALALADDMAGKGRLVASDTDRTRLSRLAPRAERAGVTNIESRLLNPGTEADQLSDLSNQADIVLVDAPCSGTGTWRRNPEARWRLTRDRLARLVELQHRLLDVAAELVKPGGVLVYAVCSLLEDEGANQIANFLGRHGGFTAESDFFTAGKYCGPGRLLSPAQDGTDGFFVARLTRAC